METTTRCATLDDLDALADMFDAYRQFYEQPANISLARSFIRQRIEQKESVIFVAQDLDGSLTGFSQLYPTFCSVAASRIYSLYDLYVRPASRKHGAGKALLLAAEQHAITNGFSRMDLTTAKTNLPAQSLYESVGWVKDEVFFAYSRSV
jgi:ribosomal protein S18 acetylase RimI-like enzyme